MKKIDKIKNELIDSIINDRAYDLSDIGNIIGIVVGKYLQKKSGFEKDDFLNGINHGFSLADGTH